MQAGAPQRGAIERRAGILKRPTKTPAARVGAPWLRQGACCCPQLRKDFALAAVAARDAKYVGGYGHSDVMEGHSDSRA